VFQGAVTFSGTATNVLSTNTIYTDSILELHSPSNSSTWTVDDGRDIGLVFSYYNSVDNNAFLGLVNTSKYLEWYGTGVEHSTSSIFTSATYGTFKTGNIILTSTATSTSTTTGALIVSGGVGIGGNLWVGGTINGSISGGSGTTDQVKTIQTATNATYYPTFVDSNNTTTTAESLYTTSSFAINPSTGNVGIGTISPSSKLDVSGSLRVTGATTITNTTSATSTISGALVVTGGVGIGGNLYVGGNISVPTLLNLTTEQLTYPSIRPSLMLDFINSNELDPRITFTRASTATYTDSNGIIQLALPNTPRFDHDPVTLAPQGFLIEESRTNSIRNNTMVGTIAGTPGTVPSTWSVTGASNGLARDVVGSGTENGIAYIDIRYYGTTSATSNSAITSESVTQVVASSGQTWVASAYVKLVGGTLANVTLTNRVNGRDVAGALLESVGTVTISPTSAALGTQRAISVGTLSNVSTARVTQQLVIAYNSGVAVDITLRIGLPQLELGAFATSAIPTTNAAVTRAADVATINTLSPWYNATEGTLYAEATSVGYVLNSSFPLIASIDDGTGNNRITVQQSGSANSLTLNVRAASVSTTIGDSVVDLSSTARKIAGAYSGTTISVSASGNTTITGTTNGVPSGLTTMRLASSNGLYLNALNGYLQRITYYPKRLTDSEIQTITT
jgi:hypothetical protein